LEDSVGQYVCKALCHTLVTFPGFGWGVWVLA
jgi:hypothetical protein